MRIEFIDTKEVRVPITIKDQFEFRKDRKHPWLQKMLFRLLAKLGCYVNSETVTFERHTVDTGNFAENLFLQERGLMSLYHARGKILLIGPDDFREITGNPEIRHMFEFSSNYHWDGGIHGMRIKVIPWMKGMLVIPELNI